MGLSAEYPTAQGIARALGGHRLAEGRYLCRCPAHDDSNPSLSVADGRCGRPVFHCFSGCDWRDVTKELEKRGLWPRFVRERR
jgi:hypothetical protein